MEGQQSLGHPSLGKSIAVLGLAERLKKVILVFFSYNFSCFKDKTIATHRGRSICYQAFLSLVGIQRYCSLQEEKKQPKQPNRKPTKNTHQLFCCFLTLLNAFPWFLKRSENVVEANLRLFISFLESMYIILQLLESMCTILLHLFQVSEEGDQTSEAPIICSHFCKSWPLYIIQI